MIKSLRKVISKNLLKSSPQVVREPGGARMKFKSNLGILLISGIAAIMMNLFVNDDSAELFAAPASSAKEVRFAKNVSPGRSSSAVIAVSSESSASQSSSEAAASTITSDAAVTSESSETTAAPPVSTETTTAASQGTTESSASSTKETTSAASTSTSATTETSTSTNTSSTATSDRNHADAPETAVVKENTTFSSAKKEKAVIDDPLK
jgi:hypothetical protein